MNVSIMVPYTNLEWLFDIYTRLLTLDVTGVNGIGAKSCSAMWNKCVLTAKHDYVIVCNDKARPKISDVYRLLHLLQLGYGLVGLYRFGFFGFHKFLLNKIGFFDERFDGGWFEDDDTMLRLKEADIAYYEAEDIEYVKMESRWRHDNAISHFHNKWEINDTCIIRKLPEEKYDYVLCSSNTVPINYLPWSSSYFGVSSWYSSRCAWKDKPIKS